MYACFLCGDLIAHISLFDFSPKASAIEIKPAVIPQERNSHRAHAVPGGPYIQTDVDGDGFETIKVDGTFSHTHTAGSSVETFKWTVNGAVVGNGVIADITLPVGTHTLTLDVVDSDGDTSSDYTTVNVKPQGFPDISSMSPPGGDVTGGNKVMISGSGFASSAAKTKVYFGSTTLTGPQINVVSESLIEVKQAPTGIMGPALVTVETEVGSSNKAYYAYSDNPPSISSLASQSKEYMVRQLLPLVLTESFMLALKEGRSSKLHWMTTTKSLKTK